VVQLITDVPQLPPRPAGRFLMPHERVVTAVRMHPAAIIRSMLWILGGAILAGVATGVAHGNGGLVLAIWLLWGGLFAWHGWKVAIWWPRYFVVTENRLMLVTSLLFTNVEMMPLAKVTDLRLRESIFGRMLGYGEFIVESAGPEQALRHIRFVPHPARIYQDIFSLTFQAKPAPAGPRRPLESPGPEELPGRAQRPTGPGGLAAHRGGPPGIPRSARGTTLGSEQWRLPGAAATRRTSAPRAASGAGGSGGCGRQAAVPHCPAQCRRPLPCRPEAWAVA
jgi:hypothetical protein